MSYLLLLLLRLSILLGIFFFGIYTLYFVWKIEIKKEMLPPHLRTWKNILKKDR
ncbi:hypothetical protein IGI43_001668 [Enterococcus sp. AZ126]